MKVRALLSVVFLALAGCVAPFAGEPTYRPGALTRGEAAAAHPETAGVAPRTESGGLAPAPEAAAAGPLTLDDCLRTALANNRVVRIADRRVLIARDRYDEAKAQVMPEIGLSERLETRNNDRGGRFGGGPGIVTGPRTVSGTRLAVRVPLYDFGLASAERTSRQGDVEVAQMRSQRTRQELEFAVRQAYFRVLEARRIRAVVQESIQVLEEQIRVARDFLEQGMVASSDVLSAEVERSQRRQELIRAEGNIELALATLNRQMGVDVTRATEVADVLEVAPWSGSFETTLRTAIETRPDLTALRKQVEIARSDYALARAGMTPRLYAFGEFDYSTDEFLLNQQWMAGGIALEIPLFDGGGTWAKLKRSRKEIAETIDLHDERVDDVVLDLKAAFLAAGEAASRIPVARETIALAEENLRIVSDRYREGLTTTADVLLEEDRLSRSRSGYFQAWYDYHEAYARLTYVVGRDPAGAP